MSKNENKVIGVHTITNNFAIFIHEIRHGIEDEVVFSINNNGVKGVKPIYYDNEDRPYFKYNGWDLYLDEFVMTNL